MHKLPLAAADVLLLLADIAGQHQEHFVVMTFDGAGQLINKRVVFIGTVNATLVHPREVFAGALADYASSIIVAHNHPSGDPSPSKEDIKTTKWLADAGRVMCIELSDHIIIARTGYFSFAANKMIERERLNANYDL